MLRGLRKGISFPSGQSPASAGTRRLRDRRLVTTVAALRAALAAGRLEAKRVNRASPGRWTGTPEVVSNSIAEVGIPPLHRFGSLVIEADVAHQLAGEVLWTRPTGRCDSFRRNTHCFTDALRIGILRKLRWKMGEYMSTRATLLQKGSRTNPKTSRKRGLHRLFSGGG
jgi:hypothetical protein